MDFAVNRVIKDNDIAEFEQNLQAVITRLRISPLEIEKVNTQIGGLDIAKEASDKCNKRWIITIFVMTLRGGKDEFKESL